MTPRFLLEQLYQVEMPFLQMWKTRGRTGFGEGGGVAKGMFHEDQKFCFAHVRLLTCEITVKPLSCCVKKALGYTWLELSAGPSWRHQLGNLCYMDDIQSHRYGCDYQRRWRRRADIWRLGRSRKACKELQEEAFTKRRENPIDSGSLEAGTVRCFKRGEVS